jgi:WD40 repeat protein
MMQYRSTHNACSRILLLVCSFVLGLPNSASALITTGEPRTYENGSSIWRTAADWDYNGHLILGHVGLIIYLWDAETGRVVREFVGHQDRIVSLQFASDGKYIISSSGRLGVGDASNLPENWSKDTSTRLWEVKTGRQLWKLEGQILGKLAPDGHHLLMFSMRNPWGNSADLAMFDLTTGRRIKSFKFGQSLVSSSDALAFSFDSKIFIRHGILDATTYSTEDGTEIAQIKRIRTFNFLEKDGCLATYGERGVEIWDSAGHLQQRIAMPSKERWGDEAAWTPDGAKLVDQRFYGGAILLFDVMTGSSTTQRRPGLSDILVNPNRGEFLLWRADSSKGRGSDSLVLSMFNMATGAELWSKRISGTKVMGFSPDGTKLICSGASFSIVDSTTGESVAIFKLLEDKM